MLACIQQAAGVGAPSDSTDTQSETSFKLAETVSINQSRHPSKLNHDAASTSCTISRPHHKIYRQLSG